MTRARDALLLLLCALPAPARAQIVSPGPLTAAHAELEGVRNCTRCHELRQQGTARDRCLACHTPLRDRIARREGLHGRMSERDCGACHKEHVGRNADIVRLDARAFRHGETGFELRGAHARVECRDCHRAGLVLAQDVRAYDATPAFLNRTWLGLGERCVDCHRRDDPHGTQFAGRACTDCHGEHDWADVSAFDHGRTEYPLTGRHRDVDCDGCHRAAGDAPVAFAGVRADRCSDCHTDPHRGAMAGACESCHSTAGWSGVERAAVARRFDHGRTRFPLRGGHARVDCDACHGRPAPVGPTTAIRFTDAGGEFPRPAMATCRSCHVEVHAGAFEASGAECSRCHGVEAWRPVSFGAERHAVETGFPLDGAHVALLCAACHAPNAPGVTPAPGAAVRPTRHVRVEFALPASECAACHAADDPHAGQFADASCASCHGTTSFAVAAFDHANARGGACASCHADDDAHAGEFAGRSCDDCHTTDAFTPSTFDHAATRFPLEGSHLVECTRCHERETLPDGRTRVRYGGLPVDCAGCHGGA